MKKDGQMDMSVVRSGLGLISKRQELIAMGHGFDYEVDEEGGGCFTSLEERNMFPPGSPCEKSCK